MHKIPNILFHGPTGSGKRTIVNDFIHKFYDKDILLMFSCFIFIIEFIFFNGNFVFSFITTHKRTRKRS
jgi:hypothetical protein